MLAADFSGTGARYGVKPALREGRLGPSSCYVTDDCVLGEVHDGWQLARSTRASSIIATGAAA